MYHPQDYGEILSQELEYLELRIGEYETLDLSRAALTDGIEFMFPEDALFEAGQYLVIVSNTSAFQQVYPDIAVYGEYTGQLANSGEKIVLSDESGNVILSVEYSDDSPWPAAADGSGYSLVLQDEMQWPENSSEGGNWKASAAIGGSPGREEPALLYSDVFINEILAHTDLPDVDAIELFNANQESVDISYWYLSDDLNEPARYQFPQGTVIQGGGYLLVTEEELGYRLDSHGDAAWLFSADSSGELTGYRHGFDFGASDNGVSFGRMVSTDGVEFLHFQTMKTLGYENGSPLLGPVQISEILYDPITGGVEYVEIVNTSEERVYLYDPSYPENGWKIEGIGFSFSTGDSLGAGEVALVVGVEPSEVRVVFELPEDLQIFGPFTGSLNNGGETVAIQYPDTPDELDSGEIYVPYIDIDSVTYLLSEAWPEPDDGWSLERISLSEVGQEPSNWRVSSTSGGSPGWLQNLDYDTWLSRYFSVEESQLEEVFGEYSDPDGDGVANLWEYALGTDPNDGESIGGFSIEATETSLRYSGAVSIFPYDLELEFQFSEDLAIWSSEVDVDQGGEEMDFGLGTRSVWWSFSFETQQFENAFLRIVLRKTTLD